MNVSYKCKLNIENNCKLIKCSYLNNLGKVNLGKVN